MFSPSESVGVFPLLDADGFQEFFQSLVWLRADHPVSGGDESRHAGDAVLVRFLPILVDRFLEAALLQDLPGGLDIEPVITHRFHYTEFEKGFEAMRTGESGKVILSWNK